MSYFPMMVSLDQKPCLIVGGGKVALRKVQVLLDFGASVKVVAPEISEDILKYKNVDCFARSFLPEDLDDICIVVAATDDSACNHEIAELCRKRKIPVNAVDQVEDCTFIFPSYWKQGEVVAGFSSGGQSPLITQYLKEKTASVVPDNLGALADCLGSLRSRVKQTVHPERNRKECYRRIFELSLETGDIPSEAAIENILKNFENKE